MCLCSELFFVCKFNTFITMINVHSTPTLHYSKTTLPFLKYLISYSLISNLYYKYRFARLNISVTSYWKFVNGCRFVFRQWKAS